MLVSAKLIIVMCIRAVWYGSRDRQRVVSFRLFDGSFFLLNLVRAQVKFSGQENITIRKDRKYIIMCNHSSHYDIPLTFMAFGGAQIRMIAKKELFKIPLFGQAMRASKTVCIDRKNLTQAIRDLDQAKKIMEEGFIVWISPEGSRLKKDGKKQLKKGGFITAIQTEAIIIPMYISGAEKILPAKTWDFYLDQEVSVKVLPQIDAAKYSRNTLPDLMNELTTTWEKAKE
ncbi:MAG: 1-acyl-sn-glycerol-3-phosphate acyltransferase [Legionellales bacterium]|nr:1-acyl-sn-glycerol-3-phosphate acyltransferase [Legionellales bacterium]